MTVEHGEGPTGVADGTWWSREVRLRLPSPVTELADDRLARHDVRLLVKRDDLIHPELPGNKWRKLKHNLLAARQGDFRTLVTFGGAYSNHIRAVAAAGAYFGFATVGVIRGEPHLPLNPSLAYAVGRGMRLTYLDRADYRDKDAPELLARLRSEYGEHYLLPEGGSNSLAVRGCAELPAEITEPFDVVCVPVGTGGTLAGVAVGLPPGRSAIGFSALKGGRFLAAEVERLQGAATGSVTANWRIEHDFHFGGYARRRPELDVFAADFATRHGLTLDPIYPAKMMYGIFALAAAGGFAPGTTVVAVLTG
ncbi:pyridoxal-phosphate dependent enzyme [Micromonospora sp. NBC_01699]|uniref:1-aminocyclopropane-1-carboxylate deaminase/D-cysteine desulfhydrase n=1 Tax=Micromonospora sp. NBC_01699 TaxID=2975984 RepID=UPI002E31BC93|nr:pyridoxal-phosphate dependent enzyme [Micromonospora sp. NBC_01699]